MIYFSNSLLKDKSSSDKKAARRQLNLEGDSDIDDMEILGLCSGKFSFTQGTVLQFITSALISSKGFASFD